MKDIDFDELDKAVNSLMATAPVAASAADEVKPETTLNVSTPDTQPVVPSAPAPAATTVTAETVTVATTQPVPSPAPATRVAPAIKRSGRFMDMVHASSDMKPRTVTSPASREGISIAPRPDSTTPPPVSPASSPASDAAPAPMTPDVMPDPLDMGASKSELSAPEAAPIELVTPTATTGDSPFIADAKVEKRPLNPSTSALDSFDSQMANELNTDDTTTPAEPAEQESEADVPPATPQVPELSSDLVAIESNDKVDEPLVTQGVETKDAAEAVEAAVPLGATSIAKQYRPQPSTGDQSHAAIYDASQYPEPVKHPAKKKSGWLWVLWVVLLLGLGAGIAVALYFMGIIP